MGARRRDRVASAVAFVGLALVLSWASVARADEPPPPGDIAGKRRIFFDAGVGYWRGTLGRSADGNTLWIEQESVGMLGFRRIPLGGGLAYAFSESFVLGARLDLALEPIRRPGVMAVRVDGSLGTFAEVLFHRNQFVRPFALVRAGLGRGETFVRKGRADLLERRGVGNLSPYAGLGVGTHVFFRNDLSFDAAIVVDYLWNFARRGSSGSDLEISERGATSRRWILRDGTLAPSIVFGFSHWW